ncbi:MAG: ATP-binding protein [Proteobacteria bacterium]|nr:ATP-binding protein [Pseudomonadota bacterium]
MSELPGPLYEILQRYQQETVQFRRVHRLIDAFEWAIEWQAILALCDLLRQATLPEDYQKRLTQVFAKPVAMGTWRNLYFATKDLVSAPWIRWQELTRWDRVMKESTAYDIVALRNGYAHGGTPDEKVCEAHCEQYFPILTHLLASPVFTQVDLAVSEPTGVHVLRGPERISVDLDLPERHAAAIIADDPSTRVLDLWPLAKCDTSKRRRGEYVVFLFRGLRGKSIDYVNTANAEPHRDKTVWNPFHALLPIDQWARRTAIAHEFTATRASLAQSFFGRQAETEQIVRFCRQGTGALLVSAGPGVGKSALLARVLESLQTEPQDQGTHPLIVIDYFIRRGTSSTQREHFLRFLCERLDTLIGHREMPLGGTVDEQDQALQARLVQLTTAHPEWRLVLVVDALDEGSEIVAYIPVATANLVVVCSSRPGKVADQFEESVGLQACQRLELGELSRSDIRALLYQVVDKYDPRLTPSYVETILAVSHGNPLYLHVLCEELFYGHLTLGDAENLPSKWESFFARSVLRITREGTFVEADRLLPLLAVARAPVDAALVARVLDISHTRAYAALMACGELLAATPDDGFILFHESLRHWLGKQRATECAEMQTRLSRLSFDPDNELERSVRLYALEHGFEHLLERNDSDRLYQLLTESELLEHQIAHSGSHHLAFRTLGAGLKLFIARDGKTPLDDQRLCRVALRAGEVGQRAVQRAALSVQKLHLDSTTDEFMTVLPLLDAMNGTQLARSGLWILWCILHKDPSLAEKEHDVTIIQEVCDRLQGIDSDDLDSALGRLEVALWVCAHLLEMFPVINLSGLLGTLPGKTPWRFDSQRLVQGLERSDSSVNALATLATQMPKSSEIPVSIARSLIDRAPSAPDDRQSALLHAATRIILEADFGRDDPELLSSLFAARAVAFDGTDESFLADANRVRAVLQDATHDGIPVAAYLARVCAFDGDSDQVAGLFDDAIDQVSYAEGLGSIIDLIGSSPAFAGQAASLERACQRLCADKWALNVIDQAVRSVQRCPVAKRPRRKILSILLARAVQERNLRARWTNAYAAVVGCRSRSLQRTAVSSLANSSAELCCAFAEAGDIEQTRAMAARYQESAFFRPENINGFEVSRVADALLMIGARMEARALCERALSACEEVDPNDVSPYHSDPTERIFVGLAGVAAAEGDMEEALGYIERMDDEQNDGLLRIIRWAADTGTLASGASIVAYLNTPDGYGHKVQSVGLKVLEALAHRLAEQDSMDAARQVIMGLFRVTEELYISGPGLCTALARLLLSQGAFPERFELFQKVLDWAARSSSNHDRQAELQEAFAQIACRAAACGLLAGRESMFVRAAKTRSTYDGNRLLSAATLALLADGHTAAAHALFRVSFVDRVDVVARPTASDDGGADFHDTLLKIFNQSNDIARGQLFEAAIGAARTTDTAALRNQRLVLLARILITSGERYLSTDAYFKAIEVVSRLSQVDAMWLLSHITRSAVYSTALDHPLDVILRCVEYSRLLKDQWKSHALSWIIKEVGKLDEASISRWRGPDGWRGRLRRRLAELLDVPSGPLARLFGKIVHYASYIDEDSAPQLAKACEVMVAFGDFPGRHDLLRRAIKGASSEGRRKRNSDALVAVASSLATVSDAEEKTFLLRCALEQAKKHTGYGKGKSLVGIARVAAEAGLTEMARNAYQLAKDEWRADDDIDRHCDDAIRVQAALYGLPQALAVANAIEHTWLKHNAIGALAVQRTEMGAPGDAAELWRLIPDHRDSVARSLTAAALARAGELDEAWAVLGSDNDMVCEVFLSCIDDFVDPLGQLGAVDAEHHLRRAIEVAAGTTSVTKRHVLEQLAAVAARLGLHDVLRDASLAAGIDMAELASMVVAWRDAAAQAPAASISWLRKSFALCPYDNAVARDGVGHLYMWHRRLNGAGHAQAIADDPVLQEHAQTAATSFWFAYTAHKVHQQEAQSRADRRCLQRWASAVKAGQLFEHEYTVKCRLLMTGEGIDKQ